MTKVHTHTYLITNTFAYFFSFFFHFSMFFFSSIFLFSDYNDDDDVFKKIKISKIQTEKNKNRE